MCIKDNISSVTKVDEELDRVRGAESWEREREKEKEGEGGGRGGGRRGILIDPVVSARGIVLNS